MAWSWSHTGEAYENARQNLNQMAVSTLAVIAAEWHAYTPSTRSGMAYSSELNMRKYDKELERIKFEIKRGAITRESLADSIWNKMAELATCTNGGHKAWCCPFGCECHMVSFSTFAERMKEAKRNKQTK